MRRLYPTMGAVPGGGSPYDAIARLYDPWSRSVTEDVDFYVEEAVASGGPVVELGVGTGRIAIPTAAAGIDVIGVDSSREMLAVCAEDARALARARARHLRARRLGHRGAGADAVGPRAGRRDDDDALLARAGALA